MKEESIFNSYESGRVYPERRKELSSNLDLEKYSRSIEELSKEVTQAMKKEYKNSFDRQIYFCGNNVYTAAGLYGVDKEQLFLMYCLLREDLKMQEFAEKMDKIRSKKEGPTKSEDPYDDFSRLFGNSKNDYFKDVLNDLGSYGK